MYACPDYLCRVSPVAKGRDIPTVLNVTEFVMQQLPAVVSTGTELDALRSLLRLLLSVAQKHRCAGIRLGNSIMVALTAACKAVALFESTLPYLLHQPPKAAGFSLRSSVPSRHALP